MVLGASRVAVHEVSQIPGVLVSAMKILLSLKPVGAGPVPALAGKTDARLRVQGRPPVAPLQSFFIRSGEPQDHGNFVVNAVSSQPPQKHKEHKESNKFQIPKNWIALLKVNILNLGRIVDQTPRTA